MKASVATVAALVALCTSSCVVVRTHGDGPRVTTGQPRSTADASAPPIARTSAFATARDGARIYYERVGSGPAIVLIHGLGGNAAVWYKQVPLFARDHTVIALSQRGFAPSEGARDRFDVHVLADDLVSVLDAAGVDRAHIVGQSMGGWTALRMAIDHPERVASLVLADTIGGIFDDEIRAHYATTVDRARELAARTPPLGQHPALDPAYSRAHPEEAYLYQLLAIFGSPPPGLIAQRLGESAVSREKLELLKLPVLFVVGERDAIFPPAIIRRAASHVPDARVATIEGSGHSPYLEEPERWQRVVRDFVGRTAVRAALTPAAAISRPATISSPVTVSSPVTISRSVPVLRPATISRAASCGVYTCKGEPTWARPRTDFWCWRTSRASPSS